MTAMVFMTGVMLPGVAVARRVVCRARVMMVGYRGGHLVGAPGRTVTGSAAAIMVVVIVWLTHLSVSV
ncbi:hypothetical protein ACWIFB_15705 [Dietzia sp. NPDC055340]